jgi:putative acetyltransferase
MPAADWLRPCSLKPRFSRAAQITCLFTKASELARPVFKRAGYTLLHRRDFAIAHGG